VNLQHSSTVTVITKCIIFRFIQTLYSFLQKLKPILVYPMLSLVHWILLINMWCDYNQSRLHNSVLYDDKIIFYSVYFVCKQFQSNTVDGELCYLWKTSTISSSKRLFRMSDSRTGWKQMISAFYFCSLSNNTDSMFKKAKCQNTGLNFSLLQSEQFYHASYAITVLATALCLSQVGVLLKWLHVGWGKQCHIIAQGLQFGRNSNGVTPNGCTKCRWSRIVNKSWEITVSWKGIR